MNMFEIVILSIIAFFLAYYFAIIIHEMGHLFFGLLSGFKFSYMLVGSVMLVKKDGKLKWQKAMNSLAAGACAMFFDRDESKFEFSLFYKGGGIFNAAFAILFFVSGFIWNQSEIIQIIFFTSAVVNAMTAVINLIPFGVSDGMKVKSATESRESFHALYILLTTMNKLNAGMRYRDFDENIFAVNENTDYSNLFIASMVLEEARRLYDQGDRNTYIKQYEKLDLDKCPRSVRTTVLLEYLYYYTIHQPDIHQAKRIHSEREVTLFLKRTDRQFARVIAAYEFFVNNDREKGEIYLEKAREFVKSIPHKGSRIMEYDRIKELEEIISVKLNDKETILTSKDTEMIKEIEITKDQKIIHNTEIDGNEEDKTQYENEEVQRLIKQRKKKEIKVFKRDINRITGVILWYVGITFAVVMMLISYVLAFYLIGYFPDFDTAADQYLEMIIRQFWVLLILPGIVTAVFTYIYGKKKLKLDKIFASQKKMNLRSFFKILICAAGISMIFTILRSLWSLLLSPGGLTPANDISDITALFNTVPLILWTAFGAPVAEEILCRGVLLGGLKKYGKIFAIVISAIIFGCIHGNFTQGIFAACLGLLYGYVTLEYSIKWAIFLHMFNNLVLALGLDAFLKRLPEKLQNVTSLSIASVFSIAAIVILIKNRKNIKRYKNENRTRKGHYKYAFRSICMILIIVPCLLLAISISLISIGVSIPYSNIEKTELLEKADEHLADDEYEEALIQYNRVLRQYQGDDEIYSDISFTYNRLYNYEVALYFADKAIETNNGSAFYDLYSNKADALKGLERKEEAIEYYEKAIKEHPSATPKYLSDDHMSLADLYNDTGQKSEALDTYKKVLSIDPEYSSAFYEILTIYKEQGKKEELLKCGENYFKKIPGQNMNTVYLRMSYQI